MVTDKTLFRCDYCTYTVMPSDIAAGGCKRCGGRKVKVAFSVTDDEKAELEARGYVFGDTWGDSPRFTDAA